MAKDNELVIKINGDIKDYKKSLKAATKQTEDLQENFNTIAKTGVIAFVGLGASILLAAGSAAKFETIQTQFEVLTGSVEEAQETIEELSEFAAKTPFKFPDIANAAKKLLAFKIEGDKIPDVLKKIGDVAAAIGTPLNDLTLIFGQVKAAGKLTGERLLQLEERAVPIGPALAKTMGVAETSIRDLVSKGEVSFKTFEKAFASLSEEGGLAFGGMAKRSKTLEGRLSTLSDNFDLVVAGIGKDFVPVLKDATSVLTSLMGFIRESPGLTAFISKMLVAGTVTGGLVTVVGVAGLGVLKLRASLIAAKIAANGLKFAVKTLIGSTGLGLIIAFLPDIIEAFKSAFGQSTDIVKKETDLQTLAIKTQNRILKAERDGMSATELIFFKNRLNRREAFEKARLDVQTKHGEKSIGEQRKFLNLEFENIELRFKKQLEAELATVTTSTKIRKESLDKKSQALKNENELIQKHLEGIEKEKIAFLKREQQIEQKARDAAVIQDNTRRELALKNVELLNKQLVKDKKDTNDKLVKLSDEKREKDFEALVKEIEQSQKIEDAAIERQEKEKKRQAESEVARQERITGLKNENELISAGLQELEDEKIGFMKREQDLEIARGEAKKLADGEEKDAALENIRLKNEELLAEQEEFALKKAELKAEFDETEAILQAELDTLSAEQRKALTEADLEELRKSIKTKEQLEAAAAKKRLKNNLIENALFEADAEKHGAVVAKFKAFQRSEELSNAQTAAAALAQLQRSENATMKAIGKAAAIVQIGINTQRGAIAAYSALAGIPFVGPALGVAAAAALTAFGFERARQVQAAQTGGVVAGAGFGDRVPFMLEPGELITPRQNFEEVISAVTDQRAAQREAEEAPAPDEEENRTEILVGFDGEEAADVLTIRQNEQAFLGVSQAI